MTAASHALNEMTRSALRRTASPWLAGQRSVHLRRGRDRTRGRNLLHEIAVPLAFDLEVRGRSQLYRLDQVVVDVGVDAGLAECVQRRARGAAARTNQVSRSTSGRFRSLPVSHT